MEDHLIQIRLSECKTLLLRNWDLLSEETKQRLREIGIQPDSPQGTALVSTESFKNPHAAPPSA